MLNKFLITIFVFFSLFSFSSTYAQVGKGDVTLSVNPPAPKAGQAVTAKINSYSADLSKSYIIWKLNDEVKLNGIGKTSFGFTIGDISSFNNVNVTIETITGQTITKELSINAADVDILWEATNSYTPPFYKGKTLFSREGEIKVIAIPSAYQGNTKTSPNNLSYTWELDGNGQVKASGFGKNYFVYKNSFLSPTNEVRVSVTDINNTISLDETLRITAIEPKVVFYEREEKGVNYNKAIRQNDFIPKEGKTLVAMPYFFSPKSINSNDLKINWFVNGEQILNTVAKNELFIKPAEGKTGTSNIRAIVENLQTLFQAKDQRLIVNF